MSPNNPEKAEKKEKEAESEKEKKKMAQLLLSQAAPAKAKKKSGPTIRKERASTWSLIIDQLEKKIIWAKAL